MAQEKLPPNEIMKNITDPAKSGERQDKNFRMFIEKTVNGLSDKCHSSPAKGGVRMTNGGF
jgi:hypothetical protein